MKNIKRERKKGFKIMKGAMLIWGGAGKERGVLELNMVRKTYEIIVRGFGCCFPIFKVLPRTSVT